MHQTENEICQTQQWPAALTTQRELWLGVSPEHAARAGRPLFLLSDQTNALEQADPDARAARLHLYDTCVCSSKAPTLMFVTTYIFAL